MARKAHALQPADTFFLSDREFALAAVVRKATLSQSIEATRRTGEENRNEPASAHGHGAEPSSLSEASVLAIVASDDNQRAAQMIQARWRRNKGLLETQPGRSASEDSQPVSSAGGLDGQQKSRQTGVADPSQGA